MNKLSTQYKEEFIDFSAGNAEFNDLASIQQEGSIALYNILKENTESIAYLADEVGMGKTFIALGTVMLMRYLNPSLRVLYIAPNRQLKDQWIDEYRRFIKNHVKLSHGHIRSFSGSSAVPYTDCKSLAELIKNTSEGYFADYFVQMNSFSFAMDSKQENDHDFYAKKLKLLKEYIPAYTESILSDEKSIENNEEVKQHYALALNYVLPRFDLIVVDESHKFKNGLRSSTRNQMLALILGTSDKGIGKTTLSDEQKRIQKKLTSKTLLLSATPFDRNLGHIRNQIELFSGEKLAQKYFPVDDKGNIEFSIKDKEKLKNTLRNFLVRRLNRIKIGKDTATRNMYRLEHRDNAVDLKGFQNKLVMALVQKHVGDLIEDKQTSSPSFQMGLLASFESFADSAGVKVFDGDEKVDDGKDQARDANLIQQLNNSYKEAGLGFIMPHPKMDEVVNNHSGENFANGEKHLFFVRRVKSVSELVQKWNHQYNQWLINYLNDNSKYIWNDLYEEYKLANPNKQYSSNSDLANEDTDIEPEDLKTDTFFSWFYKGKHLGEASSIADNIPNKDFKLKMTKKEDPFSLYFELNWVLYFVEKYNLKINLDSSIFQKSYLSYVKKYNFNDKNKTNYFNRYHAAQYAALNCIECYEAKIIMDTMYENIEIHNDVDMNLFNKEVINSDLNSRSLFNELDLINDNNCIETFILKELILTQFRQDHLMVDLYLALLVSESMDDSFIDNFIDLYKKQAEYNSDITSFSIIRNVKNNISLICETSLQSYSREIHGLVYKGLVNVYNRNKNRINLSPLDPVVGVSGATGNKSEPARKFRLPGYPIVMVATDVMQEGVNLHTFCRSITHYGLSGTPIHIEQKNGRVDRINSLTHRKIQNNKYASLLDFHSDKIQVRFPFVRQSYESFQVRRLSHNLNEYLESLHDIEVAGSSDEKLYIDKELNNNLPIPEAYTKYLETPFEIMESQKCIPGNLFHSIELKANETFNLLKLLSMHIEDIFNENETLNKLQNGEKILLSYLDYDNFYIELKPAKANGEFLLEFTKEKDEDSLIELLVGSETYIDSDEQLTHKEEIIGAVERLFTKINLNEKKELSPLELTNIIKYWKKEKRIPFARYENISFEFSNKSILFHIGQKRRHRIDIYSIEVCKRKYILFYTKVALKTSIKQELKKDIDIVKFINENDHIIGYVLHDFKHIQPKEFMYSAYVLAMEADFYEYQLSIEDQF
ncbi:DEAD/DEAH box helicase family protein [Sulfurimonas sp.]|uniref:DEAD/DEAH box helicase family protein n=1 Tax=Sulfurimonas sp. TaxID=2022749 RepID=UPI0025CCA7FF|nr:DEAD/DEAH box helicase family protein [Sulfurimonas sp.]MBT5934406.1 DEAD/DEAH box helicase family protein [Sulfurimonas sp.]